MLVVDYIFVVDQKVSDCVVEPSGDQDFQVVQMLFYLQLLFFRILFQKRKTLWTNPRPDPGEKNPHLEQFTVSERAFDPSRPNRNKEIFFFADPPLAHESFLFQLMGQAIEPIHPYLNKLFIHRPKHACFFANQVENIST